MDKIVFPNGNYYVRKGDFIDTLFEHRGTASGTYKATTKGVYLSDLQGNVFCFIPKGKEASFYNCRKVDKGYWYQNGLSEDRRELLGLDQMRISEQFDLAKSIISQTLSTPTRIWHGMDSSNTGHMKK